MVFFDYRLEELYHISEYCVPPFLMMMDSSKSLAHGPPYDYASDCGALSVIHSVPTRIDASDRCSLRYNRRLASTASYVAFINHTTRARILSDSPKSILVFPKTHSQ